MSKTRNKLLFILFLTATTIGILLLLPESFVEGMALPMILGVMYSSGTGSFPGTTIDNILHLIILITPAVGYGIIISFSAAMAYLGGLFLHYGFQKLIVQSKYF